MPGAEDGIVAVTHADAPLSLSSNVKVARELEDRRALFGGDKGLEDLLRQSADRLGYRSRTRGQGHDGQETIAIDQGNSSARWFSLSRRNSMDTDTWLMVAGTNDTRLVLRPSCSAWFFFTARDRWMA